MKSLLLYRSLTMVLYCLGKKKKKKSHFPFVFFLYPFCQCQLKLVHGGGSLLGEELILREGKTTSEALTHLPSLWGSLQSDDMNVFVLSFILFIILSESPGLVGCGYNSAVFNQSDGICSVGSVVCSESVTFLPAFLRENTLANRDPRERTNGKVELDFWFV